jgi:hypothetical protein
MAAAAAAAHQSAVEHAGIAACLAQGPQPALLPRGYGLLVLLGSSWSGKAQLLPGGKASVAGQSFSHFSIMQLMSPEGLLLHNGSAQSVRVRAAADFMTAATDKQLVGQWSKAVSSVTVTPGCNLLLHSRAQHIWGKNFTAKCTAAAGYEALYPGLSKASIDAALGEQGCQAFLQRCLICYV